MIKIVTTITSITCLLIADIGCNILTDKKQGCQEKSIINKTCPNSNLLIQNEIDSFGGSSLNKSKKKIEHKRINITKRLLFVDTQHLDYNITIERISTPNAPSCPPFCIEPIKIDKIKTVGELEVLSFIQEVTKNRDGLLIDVRKNSKYREETIPSAINLPYEMLTNSSPYQKEVLRTLGARKIKRGWLFKNPQRLLIFGASSFSPEASKAVKQLLKLGYPSNKILYYRGGILSWKAAGLTLI